MSKQHAIFIVGPDGSGKTEVSSAIASLTGMPRFKCPSEKEWFTGKSFKEHLSFDLMLPHFVDQTHTSFVSDRGYPCEWVYSRAFGRETDEEMLSHIDSLWYTRGGRIVVLARRDYSHVQDDLVDTGMLPLIHDLYDEFASCVTCLPHTRIYTDDYDSVTWAEDIAKDIIRWTSYESIEPTTPLQNILYGHCMHLKSEAKKEWANLTSDYTKDMTTLHSLNDQIAKVSVAHLYVRMGSYKNALLSLDGIERSVFPSSVWDTLEVLSKGMNG